jgi:hypothetical protein
LKGVSCIPRRRPTQVGQAFKGSSTTSFGGQAREGLLGGLAKNRGGGGGDTPAREGERTESTRHWGCQGRRRMGAKRARSIAAGRRSSVEHAAAAAALEGGRQDQSAARAVRAGLMGEGWREGSSCTCRGSGAHNICQPPVTAPRMPLGVSAGAKVADRGGKPPARPACTWSLTNRKAHPLHPRDLPQPAQTAGSGLRKMVPTPPCRWLCGGGVEWVVWWWGGRLCGMCV